MVTDAKAKLNDDTYRALGRYVVEFSGLLHALETSTVYLFGLGPDGGRTMLIEAALAGRTADPIVSAFFSVFFKRWEGQLTPEDTKIMKCLRREIGDMVTERNRLMHDAWMGKTVGGDPGPHAMSRIRVRAHGTGVEFENIDYPPEKLELLAADLGRLAGVVNGSVWYRRPGQTGPELHPRIQIIDGKVQKVPTP
jgi:hypothetical protein